MEKEFSVKCSSIEASTDGEVEAIKLIGLGALYDSEMNRVDNNAFMLGLLRDKTPCLFYINSLTGNLKVKGILLAFAFGSITLVVTEIY